MVEYDSSVLYKFAERLYHRASGIAIYYAILGAVLGALGGYVFGAATHMQPPTGAVGIGAIIVGAVALSIGLDRAFALKLQAQTLLCSVRTEENTRAGKRADVA